MPGSRQPASRLGSSALLPPQYESSSGAVRPRNRRLGGKDDDDGVSPSPSSSSLLHSMSATSSRNPSPGPAALSDVDLASRSSSNPPYSRDRKDENTNAFGILESSLAQGWNSFQGFASSLLTGEGAPSPSGGRGSRPKPLQRDYSATPRKESGTWGPQPPRGSQTRPMDVGVGSMAERRSALTAARTASVLESYEGVNGGLDIVGKYKRRNSDENRNAMGNNDLLEDQLVYIHHVQPSDTYAGIVLRYRCREDAFRRLNGLWSRDIQIRKWLALPVDACEIRGRPCDGPTNLNQDVDLLAPTPSANNNEQHAGFFDLDADALPNIPKPETPQERPWTHVRWVSLDCHPQPVEIARVIRKTMGYFPPRRKKSLHTTSTTSTPRQSLDASHMEANIGEPGMNGSSPRHRRDAASHSRHPSTSGRSPSSSTRSRGDSTGAEALPMWMRRPGGVGSMGRNVRSPGPETDYFNTWAKRHIPGIAIDEHIPSISVMGSETANFGFGKRNEQYESAALVESPFDEGHDLSSVSRQGSGLDRAAAQVETWLRSAFAKRPGTPSTATVGAGRHKDHPENSDLIELADHLSDDGRTADMFTQSGESSLMGSGALSAYSSQVVSHKVLARTKGAGDFRKGQKSE